MDKYYYLIAQLSLLKFGEEAGLASGDFFKEAEKWLAGKDFAELKKARLDVLGEKEKNFFLREYKKFELALKKELADYRKNRKKNQEQLPREVLAKELLEGNPLEVEKKLLFYRWQKIEELAQDSVFSPEAVFAYFLKLQVLEKIFEFNKEIGIKEFEEATKVEDEKIR